VSLLDHAARVLRGVTLVAAGFSALALSGVAQAEDAKPPPRRPLPPSAGISQYVEDVPSAAGPRAAGAGTSSGASLSSSAREQLSKLDRSTAQTLARIATSSAYGAPDAKARRTRSAGGSQTDRSAGSAVASAVRAEDNGNLDVVLGVLALFSVAVVGVALARARRGGADSP